MTRSCKAVYVIIFKIFLIWPFSNSLLNLLQYCFCFMFWDFFFFWPWAMWELSSLTRNQTHTSWALGGKSRGPNPRILREVPLFIIIYFKIYVLIKESQLIHLRRTTPSVWFLKYIRFDMPISLSTPDRHLLSVGSGLRPATGEQRQGGQLWCLCWWRRHLQAGAGTVKVTRVSWKK